MTAQLTITWMPNIKEVRYKPRLHVSVNLLSWSTAAMLRVVVVVVVRSRPSYAPRSNTTSHNDQEKRYSWVPIYEYGASLDNSAIAAHIL